MKPAPFEYQAPATLREAIDLLVSDPEATVIAGGQSLIPVLAFRLAAPSMLVDLRRVPGLGNISVGESGVRLGARVRWRDIEHDRRLATAHPLLREAIAHVAHYQIRTCSVMHRQFVENESTFANLDAARAYLEAFVRCYPLALAQDQPRGEALVV
jgi:CO/xanthine dehydrogenase FAD-binding subunit